MTENQTLGSSLLPAPTSNNRNPQRTAYESDQGPPKRNNRNRRSQKQTDKPLDGSISDSVALSATSPRPKKSSQPQPQTQPIPVNHSGKKPKANALNGAGVPATPAKEQAYAGSTFQASPAASSLPLPKLFSRSRVGSNAATSPRPESAISLEFKSIPSQKKPAASFVPPSETSRQSPLDVFFNADREERKNRTQSDSNSPQFMKHQEPPIYADGGNPHSPSRHTVSQPPLPSAEQPQNIPQDQLTKSLKDLLFNTAASQTPSTPPYLATPPRSQHGNNANSPSPFMGPRSGPSTPLAGPEHPRDYSLHYGNRNLSPLFQAARDDLSSRPSHLRREVSADGTIIASPPQQRNPAQVDPNFFSRQYLNNQISNSYPNQPPPPLPLQPQSPSQPHHQSHPHPSLSYFESPQGYSAGGPPPTFSPSSSQPRELGNSGRPYTPVDAPVSNRAAAAAPPNTDVRLMEENIHRMLNLNFVSK